FTFTQQNPDDTVTHSSGHFLYSNDAAMPNWKGMLTVDWNDDNWGVHWSSQFISGTTNLDGSKPKYGNEIPDYFYHNLSVSYDMDGFFGDATIGKHSQVIAGIDNLFD